MTKCASALCCDRQRTLFVLLQMEVRSVDKPTKRENRAHSERVSLRNRDYFRQRVEMYAKVLID